MPDMILRHHSAEPFTFDPERNYNSRPHGNDRSFKPHGLWLSVVGEDDWQTWCKSEEFNLDGLAHHADFELTPDANVLHLTTVDALQRFTEQYEFTPYGSIHTLKAINWTRVMHEYDGIIIAPYQWSCRHDLMWYYPWDCASGCIWNLAAVREKVTA